VPFVGLTGGLGAGKSTALAALERLGAATISTDAIVHQLYEDPEIVSAVTERFGDEVVTDGRVNRSALAGKAFATDDGRKFLEELLWPRVGARVAEWKEEVERRSPPPPAAVVEIPLLFESGMDALFDATIAVVADEEVRAARAAARGHEAVAERDARQLSQQEKAERATYAVVNDGTEQDLERQLAKVLDALATPAKP
jgi:dephospho-CoA kinase